MLFVLLADAASAKDHKFYYNEQLYDMQYIHSLASEVPRIITYNQFDGLVPSTPLCLVAHSSLLRDVSVTIEYSRVHSFAVFGIGDFTMKNSMVTYLLSGYSQVFYIAVFGRGILELINGSISFKAGRSAEVMAAKVGENLLFRAENFVLNFSVVDFARVQFFTAVSYMSASNLSFVGTSMSESLLYHAGLPVFACEDSLTNCKTCDNHYYLKNGSCTPILQSGMNCNGCIRGYVKGLKGGDFDDSLGCFEQIYSKIGENCYFGLTADDTTFYLRCGRCYDTTMDPEQGCEFKK